MRVSPTVESDLSDAWVHDFLNLGTVAHRAGDGDPPIPDLVTKLTTTSIYTQVSIDRLKKVHEATHPGARLKGGERDGAGEEGIKYLL